MNIWIFVIITILIILGVILKYAYDIEIEKIAERNKECHDLIVQEQKKRDEALVEKYGPCTKKLCLDEYHHHTVRIFEESQIITINERAYKFADIIVCEPQSYYKEEEPIPLVTVTDNGDMAARAVIGGLAFGPAGALAGALTAKTRTIVDEDEIRRREIKQMFHDDMYRTGGVIMFIKSASKPIVNIQCYKREEQYVCSVINEIIAKSKAKQT